MVTSAVAVAARARLMASAFGGVRTVWVMGSRVPAGTCRVRVGPPVRVWSAVSMRETFTVHTAPSETAAIADDPRVTRARKNLAAATRRPWSWVGTGSCFTELEGQAGTPGGYEYTTPVLDISHDGGCGCRAACTLEVTATDADRALIAQALDIIADLLAVIAEQAATIRHLNTI